MRSSILILRRLRRLLKGHEEKARSKIYTVDTEPYYFAFGVNVFPKLAFKLAGLPRVRWVVVDAYLPLRKGCGAWKL
ncbi:hypothetical protein EUGRSUZ_L01515 [Eucalyptus grandis]|uniref:MORF/ORRM1/DAG-like MORF domain-containing protein n=2 Tax=Eucalyptus grandis TaxID=71139 RepID=A0AAD9TB23_EUCGR|nr:hypothetical protein EUGRSUZ_L01515 [Eucalyptus grandis]